MMKPESFPQPQNPRNNHEMQETIGGFDAVFIKRLLSRTNALARDTGKSFALCKYIVAQEAKSELVAVQNIDEVVQHVASAIGLAAKAHRRQQLAADKKRMEANRAVIQRREEADKWKPSLERGDPDYDDNIDTDAVMATRSNT
jgi:hypothetical protein